MEGRVHNRYSIDGRIGVLIEPRSRSGSWLSGCLEFVFTIHHCILVSLSVHHPVPSWGCKCPWPLYSSVRNCYLAGALEHSKDSLHPLSAWKHRPQGAWLGAGRQSVLSGAACPSWSGYVPLRTIERTIPTSFWSSMSPAASPLLWQRPSGHRPVLAAWRVPRRKYDFAKQFDNWSEPLSPTVSVHSS